MQLSKQEKDKLHDFYRGKDLYDPSRAPEQQVSTFQPKPPIEEEGQMCGGGEVGMADGGDVPDLQETMPGMMASLADQQRILPEPIPDLKDGLVNRVQPAQNLPPMPAKAPLASGPAPAINPADLEYAKANMMQEYPKTEAPAAPAASPVSSLQPDEYSQLVQALSKKPGMGQAAMQGLGGLADAIMQGVARAGPSSFQKNIMETQQQQKQNLINALREKYEAGFRGKSLESENSRAANALAGENARAEKAQSGENARSAANIAAEKERTKSELGVRAQEAAAGRQQSGIEKAAMLPATGFLHPSTWGKGDEIEAVRSQLLNQGQTAPSLPVIKTHAQYLALPAGTKYQDSTGKAGVKR